MLTPETVIETFEHVVVALATLNELFIVSNQWVVSPSKPPNSSFANWFPSPVTTSIAYAITEPLAYFLLSLVPVPPVLIFGGINLFFLPSMNLVREFLTRLQVEEAIARESSASKDVHDQKRPASNGQVSSDSEKPKPAHPSRIHVNLVLLFPTVTAAVSNAALIVLGQSLAVMSTGIGTKLVIGIGAAWALIFGLMRLDEGLIAKQSHRALFIGGGGLANVPMQLSYLVLLLAGKVAVRKLLGQEAFMGFGFVDASLIERLANAKRYTWLEGYSTWPQWLKWAQIPISFVAPAVSLWMLYEMRKDTKKVIRLHEDSSDRAVEDPIQTEKPV